MAFPTKKKPTMAMSEAKEANQSPEEEDTEMREGSEESMPKGRRPKAKPMKDAECSACGAKSKKDMDMGPSASKKKKDYEMGPGMKMDALTPQEYLDACDLGIQHESRAYIRARLDAEERLDLKCGAGSISQGEKCHVGTAQKAKGGSRSTGSKIAGSFLGTAANLSALTKGVNAVQNFKRGNYAQAAGAAFGTVKQLQAGRQYHKGEFAKGLKSELTGGLGQAAIGGSGRAARYVVGKANQAAGKAAAGMKRRNASIKLPGKGMTGMTGRSNRARKIDSVWADGFSFDPASLAL